MSASDSSSDAQSSFFSPSYDWKQACKDAGVPTWKAKKGTDHYDKVMETLIAGRDAEREAFEAIHGVDPRSEMWRECCKQVGVEPRKAKRDTPEYDQVMSLYVDKMALLK